MRVYPIIWTSLIHFYPGIMMIFMMLWSFLWCYDVICDPFYDVVLRVLHAKVLNYGNGGHFYRPKGLTIEMFSWSQNDTNPWYTSQYVYIFMMFLWCYHHICDVYDVKYDVLVGNRWRQVLISRSGTADQYTIFSKKCFFEFFAGFLCVFIQYHTKQIRNHI